MLIVRASCLDAQIGIWETVLMSIGMESSSFIAGTIRRELDRYPVLCSYYYLTRFRARREGDNFYPPARKPQ